MREDRIISPLIGLIGACNNNPRATGTDRVVIKALAFSLLWPERDDRAVEEMAEDIYREKNLVAPGCAVCTDPCGNTSDYDMGRIYEVGDGVRRAKLEILEEIEKLAAYVWRGQESGRAPCVDNELFYKALSYVSYDMDEVDLLELLEEIKKTEHHIKSGGTQNDQEDNKN